MKTRRTMVWFLLLVITLPTVVATADSMQRTMQGHSMVRMGDLHEGERFVYDLHFSSQLRGINTTLADWFTVEIGTADTYTLPDKGTEEAFTVTVSHGFPPWLDFRGEGHEARAMEAETQYLRVPDGVPLASVTERREERWESSDGQSHKSTGTHSYARMGDELGGSFFARGEYPRTLYVDDNIVSNIIAGAMTDNTGRIASVGSWQGQTVVDVRGATWTRTNAQQGSYHCSTDHPEFDYLHHTGEESGGTLTEVQKQHVWVREGLGMPVLSTCEATYSNGAVVERIVLALELSEHVPGGSAIPVRWDPFADREAAPSRTFGEPAPVDLPGVPPEGDLALRLPLRDVVSVLQQSEDPEVTAFRSEGETPFVLINANYRPYDERREAVQQGDDGLPILPLNPLDPAPGERTVISASWILELQNKEQETMTVRYARNFSGDGRILGDHLQVEHLGQGERWITPDVYPDKMVPLGALFAAWVELEENDPTAWHDDAYGGIMIRNDFDYDDEEGRVVRQWHDVEFRRSDGTTEQGTRPVQRAASFDMGDGTFAHASVARSASEGPSSPPPSTIRGQQMALSTVGVEGYVPAAATASGMAVVAAFAAAFFFDPLARFAGQAVVAPFYAKIRKDKVLDHRLRDQIVAYVTVEPGASLSAIRAQMECGYGTAVHHLNTLERNGLLVSRKVGRERCYFVKGTMSPAEMDGVIAAGTDAAGRFLTIVSAQPGLTQREVAERLGVKDSSVRYQAKRLLEHGRLRAVKEGRTVRYFPLVVPHGAPRVEAAAEPAAPGVQ